MLTELQIEGFRGIGNLHLERTAPVNLIVGRNDTGKTTVLEAIRLQLQGDPRQLSRVKRNLYQRNYASQEDAFRLAFHGVQRDGFIAISGSFGSIDLRATAWINDQEVEDTTSFELEFDEGLESSGTQSLLTKPRAVYVQVEANGGPTVTVLVPLDSTPQPRTRPQSPIRRVSGDFPEIPPVVWLGTDRAERWPQALRYSDLYRQNKAEGLLDVLRRIEPDLEDLILLTNQASPHSSPNVSLEVQREGMPPLPLESMGDGFGSIIAIVTAVASASQGICLIDEFENGVHYSILNCLWSAALATSQQFGAQIWATTHSLDCVEAAYTSFENEPESLLVHRLQRTEGGTVVAHTFDHEMLGRALETGLEVR
jgi:predicted ATPase